MWSGRSDQLAPRQKMQHRLGQLCLSVQQQTKVLQSGLSDQLDPRRMRLRRSALLDQLDPRQMTQRLLGLSVQLAPPRWTQRLSALLAP
jgi:hypothetical protein